MPSKKQTQLHHKTTARKRLRNAKNSPALAQQRHPANISRQAKMDPRSLTPPDVAQLQGTIGNRAVISLLGSAGQRQVVQAKFTVEPAGDRYEQAQELTHVVQQTEGLPLRPEGQEAGEVTQVGGTAKGSIQRKTQNIRIDKRLRQEYGKGRINGWLASVREKVEAYNAVSLDDKDYTNQLQLLAAIRGRAKLVANEMNNWGYLSKSGTLRGLGGPFRYPYWMVIRNLRKLAGTLEYDGLVPQEMRRVQQQAGLPQTEVSDDF